MVGIDANGRNSVDLSKVCVISFKEKGVKEKTIVDAKQELTLIPHYANE